MVEYIFGYFERQGRAARVTNSFRSRRDEGGCSALMSEWSERHG